MLMNRIPSSRPDPRPGRRAARLGAGRRRGRGVAARRRLADERGQRHGPRRLLGARETTGRSSGNPTWVAGQHGQAIRFDGTGDYATVPDNASLDISSAITMAAWVKPEKTATQYLIKKAHHRAARQRLRAVAGDDRQGRSSASTDRKRRHLPDQLDDRRIRPPARPGCTSPPPTTARRSGCT